MRIAVAEIAQETDSFSPLTADLKDFASNGLYFGPEILERMPGVGPIGGFLEVVAEQTTPVEVLPIIRAWGSAGGTISGETLEFLTARLVEGLKQSLPLDGVFLSLHGAAASENEDDVEGFLLQAARAVVGSSIPVVVALDHHANITQRMVDHASVLIAHETQPHDPPPRDARRQKSCFGCCAARSVPRLPGTRFP